MSQIVVFHGTDHKAGCTMTAQSVAELIAKEKKELQVLFTALNGRKSAEYMSEETIAVDTFKIQLKSGLGIDDNALNPNKKINNLYMIAGIEHEEESRDFLPDMAEILITSLRGKFDILIIDAGSEIDNGPAFGVLRMPYMKYLVIEQTESAVRRYEKMRKLYEKLDIRFTKYILCKYFESDPLTIPYLSSRLCVDKSMFMSIGHSDKGRVSEIEYKTLLETGNETYKGDILKIANDIMQTMNLETIQRKRKRVWNSFI